MAVRVSEWVWKHAPSDLKPGEMLVALCLAEHAHADGQHAYPSINTIAEETHLSRSSVIRALDRLLALGVIAVEADATNKHPTMYRFPAFGGVNARPLTVTPQASRGVTVTPQNDLEVSGWNARGVRVTPKPSGEPSQSTATPPHPPNGRSAWLAAVGAERFQKITSHFTAANVNLDGPWLRSTVSSLEHQYPGLTPDQVTQAVRSALFKIEDTFSRQNTIHHPQAYARKKIAEAIAEEVSQ